MVDLESVAARRERLRQAFDDLDKERDVLSRFVLQWKELDELLAEAEQNLKVRNEDLAVRERDFQDRVRSLQQSLDDRERQVQRKEQATAAAAAAAVKVEVEKSVVEKLADCMHGLGNETEPSKQPLDSSMDLDLNLPQPSESPDHDHGDHDEYIPKVVKVKDDRRLIARPELKALCEAMDGDGLRKFIVDHRKEVAVLRDEIPGALEESSPDPGRMVLSAVEVYVPESSGGGSGSVRKEKETEASANRRACILLLECLQVVFADPVLGVDHPVVPPGVKEGAREMAHKWRSKMDVQRDASASSSSSAVGSYLDAQAFLQLLATFDIASEYDEDELCKLISAIARRKQTPALCRAIGLEAKIPDIVNRLVDEGKQIEALSFASEFGIMDQIQPVSLLKDYLKEARRVAQTMLKSGQSSAAAQNDSMMKELSALRSVLKCIEEYKLEADYPSSPIQKRISTLEKAKLDRKRTGGSVKGQAKRPRGSGNNSFSYRNSDRNSDRNFDRGQYVGGNTVPGYQFVSPVAFERQNQAAGYLPSYAARNTVSLSTLPPNSYLYSTADGSLYGGAYATTPSTSYGNFATIRNTLPPPPPAYQASFMN